MPLRMEAAPERISKSAAGVAARKAKRAKREELSSSAASRGRLGGQAKARRHEVCRQALVGSPCNAATSLLASPLPMATRSNHEWAGKFTPPSQATRDEPQPYATLLPIAVHYPTTPAEVRAAYDSTESAITTTFHTPVKPGTRPPSSKDEKALAELEPELECTKCNTVYEHGLHVLDGARWLSTANSAIQCRNSTVHCALLVRERARVAPLNPPRGLLQQCLTSLLRMPSQTALEKALGDAAAGKLGSSQSGQAPRIHIPECWWCHFRDRALKRELYLDENVDRLVRERELPMRIIRVMTNDGYIHLGGVFETSRLSVRVGRRVARRPDRTVKVGDDGRPVFECDGRVELLRPWKPTGCASPPKPFHHHPTTATSMAPPTVPCFDLVRQCVPPLLCLMRLSLSCSPALPSSRGSGEGSQLGQIQSVSSNYSNSRGESSPKQSEVTRAWSLRSSSQQAPMAPALLERGEILSADGKERAAKRLQRPTARRQSSFQRSCRRHAT